MTLKFYKQKNGGGSLKKGREKRKDESLLMFYLLLLSCWLMDLKLWPVCIHSREWPFVTWHCCLFLWVNLCRLSLHSSAVEDQHHISLNREKTNKQTLTHQSVKIWGEEGLKTSRNHKDSYTHPHISNNHNPSHLLSIFFIHWMQERKNKCQKKHTDYNRRDCCKMNMYFVSTAKNCHYLRGKKSSKNDETSQWYD